MKRLRWALRYARALAHNLLPTIVEPPSRVLPTYGVRLLPGDLLTSRMFNVLLERIDELEDAAKRRR